MSDSDSIAYTTARDFAHDTDEPRNSRGQTLSEYLDTMRAVHAALQGDWFFHANQKRKAKDKAKDMATHDHHDKRLASIGRALSTIRKRASFYGVRLT